MPVVIARFSRHQPVPRLGYDDHQSYSGYDTTLSDLRGSITSLWNSLTLEFLSRSKHIFASSACSFFLIRNIHTLPMFRGGLCSWHPRSQPECFQFFIYNLHILNNVFKLVLYRYE